MTRIDPRSGPRSSAPAPRRPRPFHCSARCSFHCCSTARLAARGGLHRAPRQPRHRHAVDRGDAGLADRSGAIDRRLPDAQPTVTIDLVARDAQGEIDTTFRKDVRVYTQFLGTLTPPLEQVPPTTIAMTAGVATGQRVTLPPKVLGPTTPWVDDGEGSGDEHARPGRRSVADPVVPRSVRRRSGRRRATMASTPSRTPLRQADRSGRRATARGAACTSPCGTRRLHGQRRPRRRGVAAALHRAGVRSRAGVLVQRGPRLDGHLLEVAR